MHRYVSYLTSLTNFLIHQYSTRRLWIFASINKLQHHIGSEISPSNLYLVHNAVAQHNLVRLCHSLTYHRSL